MQSCKRLKQTSAKYASIFHELGTTKLSFFPQQSPGKRSFSLTLFPKKKVRKREREMERGRGEGGRGEGEKERRFFFKYFPSHFLLSPLGIIPYFEPTALLLTAGAATGL